MKNILPSPGLCPGTRISLSASVHSKELFSPSFHSRNVLIFLIFLFVILPKIRSFLISNQTCGAIRFNFLPFFFLFLLCDFFLENVACSQSLLMLEKNTETNKNWTQSCFLYSVCYGNASAKPVDLFQGLTFVSYPWMKISISGLRSWKSTWQCLLTCSGRSGVCSRVLCVWVVWWHLMSFPASEG